MRIATWNINGIRSASRKGFWEVIRKIEPDILLIQEYRYGDVYPFPLGFEGYRWVVNPARRSGLWGTAVLYRESLPLEVVRKELGYLDEEGRFLHVRVGGLDVINAYFPHPGRRFENLEKKLEYCRFLEKYLQGMERVVVGGDFNVAHTEKDLARAKENRGKPMFSEKEIRCFERFLRLGFRDAWRERNPERKEYTWFPYGYGAYERNIGWRIDYILVKGLETRECWIERTRASDHLPVVCEVYV